MTVSCPECGSVFRVDPAKVPATGVRARCSVCGGVIALGGGTLPVSVTPLHATRVGSAGMPTPRSTAPQGSIARPAPTQPTPVRPISSQPTPVAAGLAQPTPVRPVIAQRLLARPTTQPAPPSFSSPMAAGPAAPRPIAPATPAASAPAALATPPVVVSQSVTPASSPAASNAGVPATGSDSERRPINPFLRADPAQRARRLARALVSDLVAYHPQKREEGLRDGTLRQLFREEIKKSYEEYVEQVGRDSAESSPYFQDALNEILAGGRRLF
jgi:predicted Zn finger-like uncharacterized protein